MRKLEIDGKEVKGYIIHETPMEKIVWLEEPAPYQCSIAILEKVSVCLL